LCQVIQSYLGENSYSCVKPMPHTNHTTTNQIKQPVATSVRSMETSSAAVLEANARMRKVVFRWQKWDVLLSSGVCGVSQGNTNGASRGAYGYMDLQSSKLNHQT
jgi:hypothetical protein